MRRNTALILLSAVCLGTTSAAYAVSVTTTNNATTLSNSIISDSGAVAVISGSAVYSGYSGASGTYTDGPSGIFDGAILTSGLASNAALANTSGSTGQDNGTPGDVLCDEIVGDSFTTYDAAKLSFEFDLAYMLAAARV
jgi:hypothetical protein